MGFKFNPFIGNFDFDSAASATSWLQPVSDEASLPLVGNTDGDARITIDTDYIWLWNAATNRWINSGVKSAPIGSSPNTSGYTLVDVNVGLNRTERRLILQPADGVNPGLLTEVAQFIGGDKTFNDNVIIVGDLTVNGTTTSINSTNLEVEDKNITLNKNGNDASSEEAGLTIERTSTDGSLVFTDSLASKWKAGLVGSEIELVNVSSSQTLTNKIINADNNTITNIDDNDIKANAGINATKIASGTVDNTEFEYLNGVTSNIQTQLNTKANTTLNNIASVNLSDNLFTTKASQLQIGHNLAGQNLVIFTQNSSGTNAGDVQIISGAAGGGTGQGGDLYLEAGGPSATGNTAGVVYLKTANSIITSNITTGPIFIETGIANGAGSNSGDIFIRSQGANNNSGNINISTGNAANRGNVLINSGEYLINNTNSTWWWGSPGVSFMMKNDTANNIAYYGSVDATNASQSTGEVLIQTGTNQGLGGATGNTGGLYFSTGYADGTANTGILEFYTGDKLAGSTSGNVGDIGFYTGSVTAGSGSAGGINFITGGNAGTGIAKGFTFLGGGAAAGNTGGFSYAGGAATGGNSGDVSFIIGQAIGGTQGSFKFVKSGVANNIGDVWTASSVDGVGYWAPAAGGGANTTLSNLVNTIAIPNGVHILPANPNQVNIGSNTNRFTNVYTTSLNIANNSAITGRNSTNTADINMFRISTGNRIQVMGSFYPDTIGTRELGDGANPWNSAFIQNSLTFRGISGSTIQMHDTGASNIVELGMSETTPSGALGAGLRSGNASSAASASTNLNLFSTTNTTANATQTGNINIETGNKTAGTGNSGNISLRTGTSSGGSQGNILTNSLQFLMTLGSSTNTFSASTAAFVTNIEGSNILPRATTSYDLGSAARVWDRAYLRRPELGGYGLDASVPFKSSTTVTHGLIDVNAKSMPSTSLVDFKLASQTAAGSIGIHSNNDATVNATATGRVLIESGNKTAGTGNSGDIIAQTGTSVGGQRGEISLNGRQVNVNNTKVVNVTDPTAAQDAATKNYVDNSIGAIVTPTWKKYVVDGTAFTALSNAENIELFSLPAKGTIHAVVIKHTTAFNTGTLSAYTLSVGVSGNLTKYASPFDVYQAVGSNVSQASNSLDVEDFSSPTSIRLAANSVGDNVNAAPTGQVEVYVLWGVLP